MNELLLVKNTAQKLGEYFDDETLTGLDAYDALHQKITEHITYLLLHEMEKLLQILYRIDVAEKEVKAAFAQNDPLLIAPQLAYLIIKRELKKAETRLAYRKP